MFGISFSEIVLIALIALVVVGPQKLPSMLLSIGKGIAKIRRMTNDVRAQTGIDEILREEGIDGVRELRALLRGEVAAARARDQNVHDDAVELDESQEYPPEGADAGGALPDDLVEQTRADAAPTTPPNVVDANAPPTDESPQGAPSPLEGTVSVTSAAHETAAPSDGKPTEAQKEGGT